MAVSSKLHILVIDHTSEMRTFTKDILKKMGLKNIKTATTSAEAMKEALENIEVDDPYQLIIVDYDVPGMTGVEFYDQLKQKAGAKSPEFILTMSEARPDVIKEASSKGLRQILLKPFTQQQLVEKMIKLFDKKKAA